MLDVLTFPEVNGCVGAPGRQASRRPADVAPTSLPTLSAIPGRRRGRRWASARLAWRYTGPSSRRSREFAWSFGDDGLGVEAWFEVDLRGDTARAMARMRRGARPADPKRRQLRHLDIRQSFRRGAQAVQGPAPASRSARRSGPPAGRPESSPPGPKCAGPGWRAPPARTHRTAPGTRNPGQRATTRPNRESSERCEAITSGLAFKSKRFFKRPRTSGNAGMSDVASSTDSVFRPAFGLTLSHPR